jgi:hypothetical protein
MRNLRAPKNPLHETVLPGDFPLGSTESRAAARALAERFPPPPDIITHFYKPVLDAEGNHVYGGQRCDSVRASVDHGGTRTDYDRKPGESLADFENRVFATHPRGGFSRVVTMCPFDE